MKEFGVRTWRTGVNASSLRSPLLNALDADVDRIWSMVILASHDSGAWEQDIIADLILTFRDRKNRRPVIPVILENYSLDEDSLPIYIRSLGVCLFSLQGNGLSLSTVGRYHWRGEVLKKARVQLLDSNAEEEKTDDAEEKIADIENEIFDIEEKPLKSVAHSEGKDLWRAIEWMQNNQKSIAKLVSGRILRSVDSTDDNSGFEETICWTIEKILQVVRHHLISGYSEFFVLYREIRYHP